MSIKGGWWNELGSNLEINLDPNDPRQISGLYHTDVGQAKQKSYPLVGRCDAFGNKDQLISWVVVWDPPDPPENPNDPPRMPSITSWAGQYHIDAKTKKEVITTTWLLTRLCDAGDDWNSTNVSMDFFPREKPTVEMIDSAKSLGKAARFFHNSGR